MTEQAFANFQALSNNTIAYAFGLGEVFLKTIKVKKTVTPSPIAKPNLISKNYRVIEVEETHTELCSSSSVIDMSKPHNKKYSLSRVLPKKHPQTDTICLPKKTNSNYEYSEENNNSKDSKYYCENAVVIQSQPNSFSKNPTIIYDLTYIKSGYIIGSNEWDNIFYIHEGNSTLRGGKNTTNHFAFLEKNFTGRIKFVYNSTNIIDISKLSNEDIKISWNSAVPISGLMNIRFGNGKSTIWAEQIDEKIKINIYGSRNNTDTVICDTNDLVSKSKLQSPILVNTGGANNSFYPDKIKNCNDVVVWSNSNISGEVGKYLFYIKTSGFGDYNTKSEIDVKGNVTVTFPDIVLLKDCQKIYYSKEDDILYFDISPWGNNKIFTLKLKNYQNTNYILFDKYGTHVVPKLSNNEIINSFELNARYPNQDDKRIVQELQNLLEYQKHLKKITSSKEGYKILTVMEIPFFSPDIEDYNKILQLDSENKKNIILGSDGKDIISLNKQVIYAQGNEKGDIYIAEFLLWYSKFYINNKATDQELDVLYIPYSISSMEIANISNSLKLKITNQEKNSIKIVGIKIVDVLDYFKGAEYQHLMLLDEEYNRFIPFNTSKTGLILAPFYRASNTKNVFLVSSDTKLAVIEDTNYEIYRKDYDLIFLTTNKFIGLQASIVLKDFYSDHESWKNFKFYKYNKAIDYKNPIKLPHINQDILTLNHKNLNNPDIFTVYNFDFTKDEEIFHNIEDIYTDSHPTPEENKKIGIVRFWNINPNDITVERQSEDMVLKHVNGYELIISKVYSDTYASHIDIFEFWGLEELLEPIIIYHNSNYPLQFQLLQAGIVQEAYIHINKFGNKADCLDINELKYLIALENIKDVSTAKALGFASLLEQMQYLQNYNLILNDLIKLKDCISDKLLNQYKFILHESLPLKPSSKEEVAEYRKAIEQISFSSTSVIEFIDSLINTAQTTHQIRYNHYSKTEFNIDEASYHAEFLTSAASKSNSFINNIIGSIRERINSIANIYGSEQQPQNNIFVGEKYVSLNENNIASLSNSFIVPEDNGWKQYNFYQGCLNIDSPFKQHIVSNIDGQNEVNMVIRNHSFGRCANVYHNTHIEELPIWARVCKKPKNLAEILSLPYDSNNHISTLNQNASTIIQIGNSCEIVKNTFGFLDNDNPSLKVIIPVTSTVVYVASLLPSVNLYNLPIHLIPSILSSIKDYMEDKSYMNGVIIAGKVAIVGLSAVNPLTQLAFSAYTIGSAIYSKLPQDSGTKLTIASGGAVAIITSDISSIVDVSKEIVDINKGLNNLQFVSTALNTCKMVFPYLKSLYNKITKTDNVSEDLWADGLCDLIKNIQKFPLSSQDQNSLNEISKNLPTELPEIKTTWTELLEIKDRYEKAQHDELEVLGGCILV